MAGFRSALVLGFVDHAAALADFLCHEDHHVLGQAKHARLLGFGGGAAGPGFGFTEFVLELVEYFFDVPAGLVEDGDEAWRDRGR